MNESGILPQRVSWAASGPVVDLAALPERFPDIVTDRFLSRLRRVVRVPLSDVSAVGTEHYGGLAGFIFHTPRSGSTVVARMFGEAPDTTILCELDILNQVLLGEFFGVNSSFDNFRKILGLCVAPFAARGRRVIVKMSSWSSICIGPLLDLFTETRSCFVKRQPGEILPSILRRPVGWMDRRMVPYMVAGGESSLGQGDSEVYCATVLARMFESAHGCRHSLWFIDHRSVGRGLAPRLTEFLDMAPQAETISAMERVSAIDSEKDGKFVCYDPATDLQILDAHNCAKNPALRTARQFYEKLPDPLRVSDA